MADLTLADFGWNDRHAEAFAALREPRLKPARVAVEHRGGYQIVEPELGLVPATITGRLRHGLRDNSKRPVVGDWVAFQQPGAEKKAVIHHVLPRVTRLARHAAGRETEEQILAANIDLVVVTASLALELNLRRLERYIAVAADSGARVALLLTKADLRPDTAAEVERLRALFPAIPVHALSIINRKGLKEVRALLRPGETTVLVGPSGVGKSSLINKLCGEEMLPVQEVRETDQKGRHTTSHRELLPLPNGALVIDTPGIRELQVWIDEAELAEAFADIEALSLRCKFTNCRHDNEPGCLVRDEVAAGRLTDARLAGYRKLKQEMEALVDQRRHRRQTEERRSRKRLADHRFDMP